MRLTNSPVITTKVEDGHVVKRPLAPVRRVKRPDIIAALKQDGGWLRPWQVKLLLPEEVRDQIRVDNLTGLMREMANDGQIARRYAEITQYPEYQAL